jgi:hypothetical protein
MLTVCTLMIRELYAVQDSVDTHPDTVPTPVTAAETSLTRIYLIAKFDTTTTTTLTTSLLSASVLSAV